MKQLNKFDKEFLKEVATQLTEEKFGEYAFNKFCDSNESQDFYNERYEEIKNLYINLIIKNK